MISYAAVGLVAIVAVVGLVYMAVGTDKPAARDDVRYQRRTSPTNNRRVRDSADVRRAKERRRKWAQRGSGEFPSDPPTWSDDPDTTTEK